MDLKNEKIQRFFDKLLRCLYPKFCDRCGKIVPINKDYCDCYRNRIKKISDDYCHHCAKDADDCNCESPNSVYLPEVAAVYYYSGKVRKDIIDLKFNGKRRLAAKYGRDMADRCRDVYKDIDFDIITFVPASEESYKTRRYNQSRLLANFVGGMLFVPTIPLFKKIKKTEHQHKLPGRERTKNLVGSIGLIGETDVRNKNILICDDVKTTGATLYECVSLLESAGASKVCCICIATTHFSVKTINISPILVNNKFGDNYELLQH